MKDLMFGNFREIIEIKFSVSRLISPSNFFMENIHISWQLIDHVAS